MRGWIAGGAGLVTGAVLGGAAVVALELVVAGTAWLTLRATAPTEVAAVEVVEDAAPAEVASVRAPRGRGELQLITLAPVQVLVDGAPIGFDPQQGWLADLAAGSHRLQVLNLVGAAVADQVVEIAAGQRTQLRYANKALVDQGRMPMRDASVAAAAPPPVAVVELPAPPVAVEVPTVKLEAPRIEVPAALADLAEPTLSIGSGPAAVQIKLPKLGIGKR